MASSSHRGGAGGPFYGGAAPYRSREGLSTRPVAGSDEIQLRIDPVNADLDDEITGLRSQVKQLRNVAQEIHSEASFQKDFLDQLQMTLIKAQAGVKNNMRRLNKSIVKHDDEVRMAGAHHAKNSMTEGESSLVLHKVFHVSLQVSFCVNDGISVGKSIR
ncbi:hypothetical protein WN943_008161 [Citrus x changshan-huyou]